MSHGIPVPRLAGVAFALAAVTALAALTAGPAAGSAFPGDNGRIVFQGHREGGGPEIYSINPDGTGETRLTNTPAELTNTQFAGNWEPSYSPDGRTIVFRSMRDRNAEIYTMNADGANQTRITNNPAPDGEPSFSPDGRKIVFAREVDGHPSIWVMDADGSNQRRLTNRPPFGDIDPTFSPTGDKIAFGRGIGDVVHLFVMDTDGTNQTDLMPERLEPNRNSSFSPDGRTLAFARSAGGLTSSIFTMNAADGANTTRLADNAAQPAFSPDGTKIAVQGQRNVAPEIFTMDRDGSNPMRLTMRSEGTGDVLPNWGPRPRPSARADVLHGDAAGNVICGRGGADVIHGLGGNDTLFGDRCGQGARAAGPTGSAAAASGRDRLFGGRGHDRLFGHGHADRLDGGPGRDLLHSGPGHDTFLARDGARDRVICGEGQDVARVDRRDRVSGCERVRVG